MTLKAVITDYGFDDVDIERSILEPLGCQLVAQKIGRDPVQLAEFVRDADYVLVQFAPINSSVIAAMNRCKVIVRYGIGVDNVDLAAAAAQGIPVCNVPDYCIDEVADHAMALILAATRQVVPCVNTVKAGQWRLPVPLAALHSLKTMTVGIVGLGRIGREVANRLRPFKCHLVAFDPALDAATVREAGCEPVDLNELYAQSGLITLHCPSTEQTRHLVNAQTLARMRPGVILVNTSRGTLVKTPDLVAALQSGHVSAAALDVTDPEPITPDSPLLKMDNVIITSHIASGSPEAVKTLRTEVARAAVRAIKGEPLVNVVNGVGR